MKFRNLVFAVLLAVVPAHAQTNTNPPNLSLIQLSPTSTGLTVVTGLPTSVPADSLVSIVTLDTGRLAQARASADGSFAVAASAAAGTSLLIKVDATGQYTTAPSLNFTPLPAAIVRVPEPGPSGLAFAGAGTLDGSDPPQFPAWTIQGTLSSNGLFPGESFRVQGIVTIVSPALQASLGTLSMRVGLSLEKLSDQFGNPVFAQSELSSTLVTPTGLPIERGATPVGPLQEITGSLSRTAPDRAEGPVDITFNLPGDFQMGYYRPYLRLSFTGVVPEPMPPRSVVPVDRIGMMPPNQPGGPMGMYLPVIRVGASQIPRLHWQLLTDVSSNGTRGVGAIEDRGKGGVASRVVTQSERFIIPRLDPDTGNALTYHLEPFIPAVSVGDQGIAPNPPRVAFRFPSGSLTVRVERPNGVTEQFGPFPFKQSRSIGVVNPGESQSIGNITDAYQLSTMDPHFDYQFPMDGRFVITMTGTILDIWGNQWIGGGTYEVYVARSLSLETAVLPGTPFERGDVFNGGAVISPPVPAEVQVRFRMSPDSDVARTTDRTIAGVANRFGYFQLPGHGIPLDQQGEYRVDITASYTDPQGNLWMGTRSWGGVVAPANSSIVARGSRGLDSQAPGGPQWFRRSDTGLPAGTGRVPFPFSSGDVTWQQLSESAVPVVRFQDDSGVVPSLMRQRYTPPLFESRNAVGETPLISSRLGGLEPHLDSSSIDLWAYSYRSVQGPLVRVREEISEDTARSTYWRLNESLSRQIGAAPAGDSPNDFKFLYGAAVIRGSAVTSPQYAIYGSLFIPISNSDAVGTRTFPPFDGNGGGPSGGPLMVLKGRPINLFFHPTAARPGTVLEVGDTLAIAGAVGPAVRALVSTTITKPGGGTITLSGRANSVGYYYRPDQDYTVDQPGIYTVDVSVTYDGRTSAGQLAQPFPRGDVLGTEGGRFYVYVVPRGGASLNVTNTDGEILAAPAAVMLSATAPQGVTLQTGHVTALMPGFMLETKSLAVSGNGMSYSYDPQQLAHDFPNLDTTPPSDLVTLTLFGSGLDANGRAAYVAKVVAIRGSTLMNPALNRTVGFGIPDRGGLSMTSGGDAAGVTTGYGRIQPVPGSAAPSGIAIFGFRRNGVLVSEAAVPAVAPVLRGRIYAEVAGPVSTGIAIANPNNQPATISFYFTSSSGQNFGAGTTMIAANAQIASFLDQEPFSGGSSIDGTFTFESDVPVGVIALRGLTNEAQNFMMTTLPVAPLSAVSGEVTYFPHFADGGGWSSQLILVNATDQTATGVVAFFNEGTPTSAALPVAVTIDGVSAATFSYSIPPRSARKLRTSGAGPETRVGSVRVSADASSPTASGVSVFSYKLAGVTVAEAGVPATGTSTAWRMYAEISGGAAQIQTGIAVANPAAVPITVNLELTTLAGTPTGLTGSLTLPANGHVSTFLNQIPGFASLQTPFRGVLRVSTVAGSGIALVGIRGRVNENNQFLITTTAPVDESAPPITSQLIFPHIADSGGYTTQFILYGGTPNQTAAGTLNTFSNSGSVLNLPLQ